MQKQAQVLPLDTILAGLDILAATKSRLRGTSHGRVLLEMVVVRLARLEELLPLSELVRQLANGAPAATRLPQPRSATASSPSVPSEVVKKKLGGDGIPAAPVSTQSPPATPISLTAVTLEPIWRQTLATLGQIHRLDLQKAGLPAISAPNCLVLRFSSDYNSEREHCEESARNNQLEAALAKITGTKVAVRYEAAAHAPAAAPPSPRLPRNEQIRRSALQEPLVKAVVEQLGGNLVRIDEGFGALPAASTTDSEESD